MEELYPYHQDHGRFHLWKIAFRLQIEEAAKQPSKDCGYRTGQGGEASLEIAVNGADETGKETDKRATDETGEDRAQVPDVGDRIEYLYPTDGIVDREEAKEEGDPRPVPSGHPVLDDRRIGAAPCDDISDDGHHRHGADEIDECVKIHYPSNHVARNNSFHAPS